MVLQGVHLVPVVRDETSQLSFTVDGLDLAVWIDLELDADAALAPVGERESMGPSEGEMMLF